MNTTQTWHLYILACRDESLYVGITNDLEGRLWAHQGGKGGRYTRSRLPVRLAAHWSFECDRSFISRLEQRVKKLNHTQRAVLVCQDADPHALDHLCSVAKPSQTSNSTAE